MDTGRDGEGLPLTSAQYGIWLGQQLDPESPAYWTAEAQLIKGPLNMTAFEAALEQAVNETEALHRCYASDGSSVWQTLAPSAGSSLILLDISGEADPWEAARRWMKQDLERPADLANGPLYGNALLKLSPESHVWCLRAHHIALDGFGYALFTRRVAELYAAASRGVEPPPARNTALAPVVAEDQKYQQERAEKDRAFWVDLMAGVPEPRLLAPPSPVARSVRKHAGVLPSEELTRWQVAAQACNVDWTAWFTAVTALWLFEKSQCSAQTLGLPVMGRLGSVALSVPCMAMNIVPLPLRMDKQATFTQLAQQVAGVLKAIRPHQRYRYEHLKNDLGMAGGRRRLFGPVLNLMPFDRPLTFGDLEVQSHPVSAGPVEDLSLTIAPRQEALRVDLEGNPHSYSESDLAELHAGLLRLIEAAIQTPDQPLRALADLEAPDSLPVLLRGEPLPEAPTPVLSRLLAHATAHSGKIAIQQDGMQWTYGQLLSGIRELAARLLAHGVTPQSRVALLLGRHPQTIQALLAVLWVGSGYVPIDPDGPQRRIDEVLEDARPAVILTRRAHADKAGSCLCPTLCLDALPETGITPLQDPVPVAEDSLAYMIYTSGTTGRPNGVMISRSALAHFVAAAGNRYGMNETDRVLQFAPLHFDACIEEIFLSLGFGGTLVLRTESMMESLAQFLSAADRLSITVLDLPTAFWHELAFFLAQQAATPFPASVRLVIIGGEAALAERIGRWRASVPDSVQLLNTYGPTEATVVFTTAVLAGPGYGPWEGEAVPIGEPLPGLEAVVVDSALTPVEVGQPGELCLLGPTLSLGYFGREQVTAERFVALTALPGAPRAYRTGDRVQMPPDGRLRYLGRLDDEFKLSGHRIDPSEVETALLRYPGVGEAAVVGQVLPSGLKRLAAFLVMEAGLALPPGSDLRVFLSDLLPAPAIPSSFSSLDRLPRTANGKIDRNVLRGRLCVGDSDYDEQMAPMEQTVAVVWREVLGLDRVSQDDDFFLLGGKSLQAIQAVNRLGMALHREIPVSWLFRFPTVSALSQQLSRHTGAAKGPLHSDVASSSLAPLLTIQSGEGPGLFCLHPVEGLAWCYMGLSRLLPQVPIYGLQARGLTDGGAGGLSPTLGSLVEVHLQQIRQQQPHGPYHLLGWSFGGLLAYCAAAQLQAAGEKVALLALLDSYPSSAWQGLPPPVEWDAMKILLAAAGEDPAGLSSLTREGFSNHLLKQGSPFGAMDRDQVPVLLTLTLHHMKLLRIATTPCYAGDVLLFRALRREGGFHPESSHWRPYIGGEFEEVDIDCTHYEITRAAALKSIGPELARRLGRSGRDGG